MPEIEHQAKIVKIMADAVEAEMVVQSACAHCALQKSCQPQEASVRKIVIPTKQASKYCLGEKIWVEISLDDGWMAAFFAYILPLILVLTVLLICLSCRMNEIISGICSIIVLIPYYFGVFLKRDFFVKKLNFKIVDKI